MDPIIPSSQISVNTMCSNLYTLLINVQNQTALANAEEDNDSTIKGEKSYLESHHQIPFEYYLVKVN